MSFNSRYGTIREFNADWKAVVKSGYVRRLITDVRCRISSLMAWSPWHAIVWNVIFQVSQLTIRCCISTLKCLILHQVASIRLNTCSVWALCYYCWATFFVYSSMLYLCTSIFSEHRLYVWACVRTSAKQHKKSCNIALSTWLLFCIWNSLPLRDIPQAHLLSDHALVHCVIFQKALVYWPAESFVNRIPLRATEPIVCCDVYLTCVVRNNVS